MTIRQRLAGLAALAALASLLVGMPILLLALLPIVRWPIVRTFDDVVAMLLRPDDGTLALALLQVVAWVCWIILAVTFCIEISARLRRISVPRIRVIAGPQLLVRGLVAAAATLFISTSSVQPVGTATAAPITATPDDAPAHELTGAQQTPPRAPATVSYTVQPGDSLWSIAQRHLSAGERYPEIIALNPGKLVQPDFLHVGWTLTLPATSQQAVADADAPPETYVVRKGDTLRRIAQAHLGDADRYTEIFDASTTITQPDGRRLTDPDLIHPGWTLNLHTTVETDEPATEPAAEAPQAPVVPSGPSLNAESATVSSGSLDDTMPASGAEPGSEDGGDGADQGATDEEEITADQADAGADSDDADAVVPPWTLVGLTGAGAGLAASLFVMLRHRRASQHRWRRPGRSIALPSPDLAAAEKTIITIGADAEDSLHLLDDALRTLVADQVAAGLPIPDVAAVEFTNDDLVLHLTAPCPPAARWTADDTGQRWQAITLDDAADPTAGEPDTPAPYPQLVTIGTSDDGARWLLNLEIAGIITLTGDPARIDSFIRFVIAELATNPWSRDVHITCVGTGLELDGLEPRRVTIHPDPTTATDDLLLDTQATVQRLDRHHLDSVHAARALGVDDDLWDSHILITDHHPDTDLNELLNLIDTTEMTSGTTIIRHSDVAATFGEVIELTDTGRLRMPNSGLDLTAVGLTDHEADDISRLMRIADDWNDEPIPSMDAGPSTWQHHVDHAGHLHATLTIPRGQEVPPDAATLLPEPDDAYLDVAATTADDLATLAPHVPSTVRDAVVAADPDLDADLARWRDDPDTPKLTILGPVRARVGRQGRPVVVAKRRSYYTEMLTYLATRTHGATTDEVAEAFGISSNRVRKDISVLREWLGTNPHTGRRHVPEATRTRAAQRRGVGAYEVEGLLVDADLFRRLRARGEAQGGEAGIHDLQTALDLATGEPLSLLKNGGRPGSPTGHDSITILSAPSSMSPMWS